MFFSVFFSLSASANSNGNSPVKIKTWPIDIQQKEKKVFWLSHSIFLEQATKPSWIIPSKSKFNPRLFLILTCISLGEFHITSVFCCNVPTYFHAEKSNFANIACFFCSLICGVFNYLLRLLYSIFTPNAFLLHNYMRPLIQFIDTY